MQTLAPPGQVAVTRPVAGARRLNLRRALTITLFLLPAASLYSLFVLFPLVQAGYYGLYKWKGLGPLTDYVGLENFNKILHDEVFRQALGHNLIILILSVTVQLPLAILLALLVGRKMRGRAFFRTVFFLPFVISEVVTGVIWSFLYHPQTGINDLLSFLIPGFQPRGWLGDPNTVLYALFVVITWRYVGFHIILYLAGLQNIPREVEEAALIDGASQIRVARDITIPLLGPTIRLSVFLSVIGSLQFFDLIWVMTTGGPVNASHTMATYMYRFGFVGFHLGYGAAVSVVIFVICFGFSLCYQRFVMRRDYAGPAT
ncbi:MAG: carbohydrate ABC transporter permease [Thermomicrobiales bacterium]